MNNCKRGVHDNHRPDTVIIAQQRAEDGVAPPVEATPAIEAVPDKIVEDITKDIAEVVEVVVEEVVKEVVAEVSISGL